MEFRSLKTNAVDFNKVIPAVLLAALMVFCMGRSHSLGVHCGDDALNATVAKNLLAGLGYGSTLHTGEIQLFDNAITPGLARMHPPHRRSVHGLSARMKPSIRFRTSPRRMTTRSASA